MANRCEIMNENTIKVIEEQLRLRSERLTLSEKEFRLEEKKRRGRGITLAVVALFVICGMAVFFGGCGLWNLSGKIVNVEKYDGDPTPKENGDATRAEGATHMETGNCLTSGSITNMDKCKSSTKPKENGDTACLETTTNTMLINNLAVVSPPAKGEVGIVKAENKMTPDRWPLVVAILMYGLLVLAGLGVAAFTVKHIANYHNELE